MPQLKENYSLQSLNTFGLDVRARWFIEVFQEEEAVEFIVDNLHRKQPLLILGGGSNMLLTQDIEGVVLKNSIRGKEVVDENEDHVLLKVGAGENWHELVLYCLEQNWGGIENLSLIPGCVGAAPIQNIGAYGVEIKEVFSHLDAINLATGNITQFDKEACEFGYRDSIFKREAKGRYMISAVYLTLTKRKHKLVTTYAPVSRVFEENGEQPTIKKISDIIIGIRQSKLPDPKEIGNSGSFFKNPIVSPSHFDRIQDKYEKVPHYPAPNGQVKLAAGWLIEMCGWKGQTFGNYGVHAKQALVLVNYGGARGKDIYNLSERIQASVKSHFGILLEREVNVL
ncbi:MAG: UDP-N-acetylmuramate dehydrogenase [Bacteroidota bacterium]